jgi:hypothetical protein
MTSKTGHDDPVEATAVRMVRRLYEATGGRPMQWRVLVAVGAAQAAVERAVERGWIEVVGGHGVCLTEAGGPWCAG